jgi:D-ribose pyranase
MKKRGILNPELAQVIASLGKGDSLVVSDAGLAVAPEVKRIELAVTAGVPRFMSVLAALLQEMHVERAVVARELVSKNPAFYDALVKLLGRARVDQVSNEELLRQSRRARAVVRTGEVTPFANVILFSGTTF